MAKIYKMSDRIKLKIDDLTVVLAPLNVHAKAEIQALTMEGVQKQNLKITQDSLLLAVKYSLKDISGLENSDGSQYVLTFDEQGLVTDECIDELCNLHIHEKLIMACTSLVRGIKDEMTDQNGKKIEGVEVVQIGKKEDISPN